VTNAKRQYGEGGGSDLGEDAVITHSVSPHSCMAGGQTLAALTRLIEGLDFFQVGHHTPLYGTIELLVLAVELFGGLNAPPRRH